MSNLAFALSVLLLPGVEKPAEPRFTRHVEAVFSRLGCNSGTCHGAVKGQNGFSLSLFGADPALDHARLLRGDGGRRLNLLDPGASLLLRKATGQVAHEGGKRMGVGSSEYEILRRWIAAGAGQDAADLSRVRRLIVTPARHTLEPGKTYRLRVEATFADDTVEDVTRLCSYASLEPAVATVASDGLVTAQGVGDAALVVRYRAEPALAMLAVPRASNKPSPEAMPHNFIDRHILAKLRRLQVPPVALADDATFLRRVSLDIAGALPSPGEIRAFLADRSLDKRARKIDELLSSPGYAALWTLRFCDLLKATDFGVYADGIRQEIDAPRFQAWVRARLEENTPYDEFVERILTATSRDGRDVETWSREVLDMEEGYGPGRKDIDTYRNRKTLDLYWQRSSSSGVDAALQVSHAFLGLRLECAQCHRHPHDVWQQDDLLSFANFFMPVCKIGFQGDNEKKFPEVGAIFARMNAEAKTLADQVKKLREGEYKKLDAEAKVARAEVARIGRMAEKSDQLRKDLEKHQGVLAKFDEMKGRIDRMDRRGKLIPEAARRVMHSEVRLLPPGKTFASVTSPLGTQGSKRFRLLGRADDLEIPDGTDPRRLVMVWMRRRDNPYFARAIVNRVWAHYFGRGIIDPPDNLSPFNPASHPELLQELCDGFLAHNYDLKWLHRAILHSRTYQQDSAATEENRSDRANYASFYLRRLPAEILVDALNQATGTPEKMDMESHHWPKEVRAIEIPFTPRNPFVAFVLSTYGQPKRNAAVQCDCERDGNASVLQVLSLANHPRIRQKIADDAGQAARVAREITEDAGRVEELFLVTLCRLPTNAERKAGVQYLEGSASPRKGCEGILWALLNTREFILQH